MKFGKFSTIIETNCRNFKGLYIHIADFDALVNERKAQKIRRFGYTVTDVARKLNCKESEVKKLVSTGELPFTSEWINSGGTKYYHFDPGVIDEYFKDLTCKVNFE